MNKNHSKRQSRELALKILYKEDFSVGNQDMDLSYFTSLFRLKRKNIPYAKNLVEGVRKNKKEIDESIQKISKNWDVERMSRVDLNVIRISVYELLKEKDSVPFKVVINEAVEIAKKYGNSESPTFVNGILDQVTQKYVNPS